ncbi:hypothetical protein C7999DRAFT_14560 [Corynascus novoguineensis]|uniref:BZIP domain-containing protein n=1 Tax=Corynascus novoguineensis TaxID=1126955 RepID=A0AAN7HQ77_9PEZI|nr:hypothetical protein C7999DRAFT_14560 [Corynascus novoguineensis]
MASTSQDPPSQQGYDGRVTGRAKNPLETLNIDFLRSVSERRTKDGQPQKRRGPKPDSKPPLTRRQELNRQAQRTHRERKELYIRALEDEVLRLKEIFSHISQDKERLAEENRQLKAMLAQHGLGASVAGGSVLGESTSNLSIGYSPSASMVGSYAQVSSNTTVLTPPPLSSASSGGRSGGLSPNSATCPPRQHPHQHSGQGGILGGIGAEVQKNQNPSIDYEQAGIDFVLTLEKPCMNHLPWLLERSSAAGTREPCGHALMASCPPEPFAELSPEVPFNNPSDSHSSYPHIHNENSAAGTPEGFNNQQRTAVVAAGAREGEGEGGSTGTWTINKGDLTTLLDLSKRLNLDGEITPVMAWGMVLAHPRLTELRLEDFARLAEELRSKVRCYGFGAVMEEFEVKDALENVFSMKPDFGMSG